VNWLDIVLIVAIGLTTFIGLRKGIIKMALTLAGLVLGIFLACLLYTSPSPRDQRGSRMPSSA